MGDFFVYSQVSIGVNIKTFIFKFIIEHVNLWYNVLYFKLYRNANSFRKSALYASSHFFIQQISLRQFSYNLKIYLVIIFFNPSISKWILVYICIVIINLKIIIIADNYSRKFILKFIF